MTTLKDPVLSGVDAAFSLSLPKGTQVIAADDMRLQERMRRVIEETYASFGFQQVTTPLLAPMEQLAWKYAPDAPILEEVYQLSDRGQRSLGLRYDLTVPFCRWVADALQSGAQLPLKRYEVGRVFRDGPIKEGRLREFVQCDADIAGATSVQYDIECLLMADMVLERLGFDAEIEINQNQLLRGMLRAAGVSIALEGTAMLLLDKWKKLPPQALREEALQKGIPGPVWSTLVEWLAVCQQEPLAWLAEMARDNEAIAEGLDALCDVIDGYEQAGGQTPLRVVPGLARGLGIYTGVVYEIFCKDRSLFASSLGSGGRYDEVIPSFVSASGGKAVSCPGVGLSFGLTPLQVAWRKMQQGPEKRPENGVWIIPQQQIAPAMQLANTLRRSGFSVEVDLTGRRPKKSFKKANAAGAAWVLFFGEREWEEGLVCVKDMTQAEQSTLPVDDILAWLRTNAPRISSYTRQQLFLVRQQGDTKMVPSSKQSFMRYMEWL